MIITIHSLCSGSQLSRINESLWIVDSYIQEVRKPGDVYKSLHLTICEILSQLHHFIGVQVTHRYLKAFSIWC